MHQIISTIKDNNGNAPLNSQQMQQLFKHQPAQLATFLKQRQQINQQSQQQQQNQQMPPQHSQQVRIQNFFVI